VACCHFGPAGVALLGLLWWRYTGKPVSRLVFTVMFGLIAAVLFSSPEERLPDPEQSEESLFPRSHWRYLIFFLSFFG
jgi:hypothetical protein